MLKANPGPGYPGAFYVASEPVTAANCCLAQSVQLLAAVCVSVGVAYSIIGGEIFMEITSPDLLDECQGLAPTCGDMMSEDVENGIANTVATTNAGAVEGEVWLGDAATYAGSVVLVQQTVDAWADISVDFTAVQGAHGASPPPLYLYVLNACGRPNAVGRTVTMVVV